MLFRESLSADRSADEIVGLLTRQRPSWLRPLATWAWQEQDVEVGPGDPLVHRAVRVDIESARRRPDGSTAVPVRWRATSRQRWFPTLEGELVVSAAGPGTAKITFVGHYDPPLGIVGRAVDDALLHGLAHDTILAFLRRVVDTVGDVQVGGRR